jgi:SAM-dependent methyltransferase
MLMEEFFYELYHNLPRQGPGCAASTRKAFASIPALPAQPDILDVGCGSGLQTLELARITEGQVTAVDNYQYFLDELSRRAREQNIQTRITCVNKDMNQLDFDEGIFNLIWSEGAIYIIGFEKGLREWQRFLKKDGYIAVTEIAWFKDNPPKELADFWAQEVPGMKTEDENVKIINECGYTLLESFRLPQSAWWDDYYLPLEKDLIQFEEKFRDNRQAWEFAKAVRLEIDMYRKYSDYYGYVFYIMQK